jgi:galactokinase
VFARAQHALMLDCRSLQHQLVPIPPGVSLVICNSMVRHALASGEYNRRREDCEAAVAAIRSSHPAVRALRDVTLDQLDARRAEMTDTVYRRARHVISENARVEAAAQALGAHDLSRFGALMYESHRSLRDDYQVSCRELDILVESAARLPGVYGARMTGGGFGGCTVNLVAEASAAEFGPAIAAAYKERTGQAPAVYVCSAADGAGPA